MNSRTKLPIESAVSTPEDEAAELLVQRLYGEWSDADQQALETRLEKDSVFAQAYRQAQGAWDSLDTHAEAPEVMEYRAEAMTTIRRANARRWFKPNYRAWGIGAAAAAIALAVGVAWLFSLEDYKSGEYRTDIGEQRLIELADHSRVTLDANTRIKVRFTDDTRSIVLVGGQAQFSVASDPARPFKVHAGDRTIVALGTVFTVEYVDRSVHVAMLEGKVAVLPPSSASASATQGMSQSISLVAGEALKVARDGNATLTPKADLEAVTAWRNGKVIFRTETVSEAVARMNRYSHLQIQVDDAALESKYISGVFEAGDTRGFVSALQRYLPVDADYSESDVVRLKSR